MYVSLSGAGVIGGFSVLPQALIKMETILIININFKVRILPLPFYHGERVFVSGAFNPACSLWNVHPQCFNH
jgi:hypothetical protein